LRGLLVVAACIVSVGAARADEVLIPEAAPPLMACGAASGDWMQPSADERLFSARVAVPDAGTGCPHTQLLRWHFTAPAGVARSFLSLRARYQHGFVAYLDGAEVARRRLPNDAALDALASDLHGPEWEHIPLPVRGMSAGTHVLAVEVHPRTPGREPSFDVALSASDAPRITIGPYLVETNTRSARVAFETDVPTSAALSWGTSEELGTSGVEAGIDGVTRRHIFDIKGLRAATGYHYRVSARAPGVTTPNETEVYEFHTPPDRDRPLRFVIYGDVRSGHEVHADLARAIRGEDPDLAIMTGDLVDMGSDEADWTRYFEIATPLLARVPVYPSPGNHEYARGGRGAERFRALFRPLEVNAPAWRSYDVAGVHFVGLDSNQYRSAEQLAWLRKDLERAQKARAIFVYAHEGAFSSGLHGDNELAKANVVPILERAGVTYYVGGHDHHYERGRVGKLDYIVSGGGGAELRTQRCGVPGRKACLPRVIAIANEHHYILVEVLPRLLRLCPKRADGSAIEACVSKSLAPR